MQITTRRDLYSKSSHLMCVKQVPLYSPHKNHLISIEMNRLPSVQTTDSIFDKLYTEYGEELYRFIISLMKGHAMDAEDCFQHMWLKVHTALPHYTEQGTARGWLFRIARNCVHDAWRHPRNALSLEKCESEQPLHSTTQADEPLLHSELAKKIDAAVSDLSPKLREVYLLRITHELSFAEMSEILNQPVNRLLARMHLAVKQLRLVLADEMEDHHDL